ncbi:MAG TPA: sodium:calcium antiporter [Armatimonadota bacterium]|nr:sodium:calcium antiporter [Armatimonadota bacterium]
MKSGVTRKLLPILFAILITLPGIYVRIAHIHLSAPLTAIIAGVAILGASFLLLWACDAAQADIPQALALAVVALIAVLPEYAVDMYFTWQAGQHPAAEYRHFAIANMTGANRLLIGVAWVVIVVIFWFKTRKAVRIERERRTELFFLGLATVYAFIIPIKGSLAWYDGIVFLGLYAAYIFIAGRRPCEECDAEGPAELLMNLPKQKRQLTTSLLFIFAAAAILANAEPFSEGLIGTGTAFHVSKFLLVQWLAPIASEAPEFIVAIMFTLRGKAGLALGSLLSAKLNQWTLLVGMIPGIYSLSAGHIHPMVLDNVQRPELLLTAAQSLLAVLLLASLRLNIGQALLLFGLFAGQLILPNLIAMFPSLAFLGLKGEQIHQVFSIMYITAAIAIFVDSPKRIVNLWQGRKVAIPGCGENNHHQLAHKQQQEEEALHYAGRL